MDSARTSTVGLYYACAGCSFSVSHTLINISYQYLTTDLHAIPHPQYNKHSIFIAGHTAELAFTP